MLICASINCAYNRITFFENLCNKNFLQFIDLYSRVYCLRGPRDQILHRNEGKKMLHQKAGN